MVSCVLWFRAFANYFNQFRRQAILLIHLPWYHRNPNIYDVCQNWYGSGDNKLRNDTFYIYKVCFITVFIM